LSCALCSLLRAIAMGNSKSSKLWHAFMMVAVKQTNAAQV
jgi:hypothetical protein